ncbi:MAG: factor-independent urate hydroxylase [Acidobacteriota bacterium]
MLADGRYGKSGIRLLHRSRLGERHEIRDLTVAVSLEGDFAAAHVSGDNAAVLPTDTMKNAVYALARTRGIGAIESFALLLAEHFLEACPAASAARISISERPWQRLPLGAGEHPSAFIRPGEERRVARVERSARAASATVSSGIEGLTILKASGSGFSGFLRDRFTTLRETEDRVLATSLAALWRYDGVDVSWDPSARAIRSTLLDTFAAHESASVQHTLHAMGEAVLETHADVAEIHLSMPNKHHIPVDLSPFALDNPGEVYLPIDEPFGLIEARFRR